MNKALEFKLIESDYQCNVCAKYFKHESEVNEHQVKHSEAESVVWLKQELYSLNNISKAWINEQQVEMTNLTL